MLQSGICILTVTVILYYCSVFSAAVGLLYPHVDKMLGRPHKFKTEWSSVMRCIAVFVGINHASAVSFTTLNDVISVIKPVLCMLISAFFTNILLSMELQRFEFTSVFAFGLSIENLPLQTLH